MVRDAHPYLELFENAMLVEVWTVKPSMVRQGSPERNRRGRIY